jgi:uncharacterized Fe-S cluster-containing protein
VAPSFAAVYGSDAGRLPGVLRRLGFKYAAETAEGARYVTERSFDKNQTGNICTACPAVVEYAEKYRPQWLGHLIPVVSPMIAHGRLLKARYKNCAVVFIGPCAAKKEEIRRPENVGAVDFVLTFRELAAWLKEENIDIAHSVESGFDTASLNQRAVENASPAESPAQYAGDSCVPDGARLFPLEGGMLKAGGFDSGVTDRRYARVSGAEAVAELFEDKNLLHTTDFIEPLFCNQGCINGPAMPCADGAVKLTAYERRKRVVDYWAAGQGVPNPNSGNWNRSPGEPGYNGGDKNAAKSNARLSDINYRAVFTDKSALAAQEPVSESEIQKILAETGKLDPTLQLNCEACGYKSCVENAKAIARGMAEREMCIPFMRRLAQQRTDRIIDTTPNGVVILDGDLCIIKMNPAFQKMFMCNNSILGRRISYLVNASGYEEMRGGTADAYEGVQIQYGMRYHEILYALRDEGQYVGIYSDISRLKYDAKQLDAIKMQTLTHAKEFLDHQIRFAQEMAHYLGKSTAESEAIAKRLIGLYEGTEIK